jgi:hypothetical protein
LYRRWTEEGAKPSATEWREARQNAYTYAAAYAAATAAAARQQERQRQADYLITLLETA